MRHSLSELREKLASIEHERWAHWQRYMHSVGTYWRDAKRMVIQDGAMVIPRMYVEGWERQINTPYAELSEREQASDLEQVDRYWPLIEAQLEFVAKLAEIAGVPVEQLVTWDNERDFYFVLPEEF